MNLSLFLKNTLTTLPIYRLFQDKALIMTFSLEKQTVMFVSYYFKNILIETTTTYILCSREEAIIQVQWDMRW